MALLSVTGARAEPGSGFRRASAMSFGTARRMRSVDEASGMVILVGKHETVSEMRTARIANIQ
jgi:hypothetical protein